MPSDARAIYFPEAAPIAEPRAHQPGGFVTRPWVSFFNRVRLLLEGIALTGTQNGVVITDETGTPTVTLNNMENAAFDAANYTAVGGGWTVQEADVVTYARNRLGRMMTVAFIVNGTTVTGAPTALRVVLPGGEAAARAVATVCYLKDNGTPAAGLASVTAAGGVLEITRLDGAAFAASTNATDIRGELIVDVE